MTLYYVHEHTGDQSLLTRSMTPKQAVRSFLDYHHLGAEKYLLTVHRCDADLNGMGAIGWNTPGGMVHLGSKNTDEWLQAEPKYKFKIRIAQFVEEVAEIEVEASSHADAIISVRKSIEANMLEEEFAPNWSDGDDTHEDGVLVYG